MRVIDASALVKYVNREKGWQEVENTLLEGCATIDLAFKEVANALWKRVRLGELREDQASEVMNVILNTEIVRTYSQKPLLAEALELSFKLNIPVYDSLYVILAKKLKISLVTSDVAQAEKARLAGVEAMIT